MSKNQHEQIHMPYSEGESLYAISESAKIKKVSNDFWWKRLTTSHELPDFSQADMIQSAWYDCIPGAGDFKTVIVCETENQAAPYRLIESW